MRHLRGARDAMIGRRLDYLGLVAFVTIADHGSFQRAAGALNLSQAALSRRLGKIEDDLGAPLFVRSSREVSLTQTGQRLLPEARRLLKELHDVYEAARIRGHRVKQSVSFACLPTVANAALPGILGEYASSRADIAIRTLDIPVSEITEKVRSGEAEFGITIVSAELTDMRVRPLFEEEYLLFVPLDHPLAKQGHVDRVQLEGVPMARINTQSRNRRLVDATLGTFSDRIDWQFEVQNASTAIRMVVVGAALTILPRSALMMAPGVVTGVPFHDVRMSRTLGIVTRRGVPLSPAAVDLLTLIETRFREMGDEIGHLSAAGRSTPRD